MVRKPFNFKLVLCAWLNFNISHKMKVIDICPITGKGDALFTDESFSWTLWQQRKLKKKLLFSDMSRRVVIEITSVESVRKTGGEYFGFLVPTIADTAVRNFIIGREYQVL